VTRQVLATTVWLVLAVVPRGGVQAPPARCDYLGQQPPGNAPRIFAPGIVSRGNIHGRLAISPDGCAFLWTTVDMATFSTRILEVQKARGRWTDPQAPPFAGQGDTKDPGFSPDGTRLYFSVRQGERWATQLVERLAERWAEPRAVSTPFQASASFTTSGRAYFSAALEGKVWNSGIFAARASASGGVDGDPLGPAINVPNAIDYTPYIAPDESFLLFTSNRPLVSDKEDVHIHVAFRTSDGAWSAPQRVFDIAGRFPSLSPDGRYLFFCGDDGNIYWADVKVLEPLRRAARRTMR
jgi:hypothetical protein